MRSETIGHVITEVPGIESITVERSERSEYGIRIVLDFHAYETPMSFGVDELGELIDALTLASGQARRMMAEDNFNAKPNDS